MPIAYSVSADGLRRLPSPSFISSERYPLAIPDSTVQIAEGHAAFCQEAADPLSDGRRPGEQGVHVRHACRR